MEGGIDSLFYRRNSCYLSARGARIPHATGILESKENAQVSSTFQRDFYIRSEPHFLASVLSDLASTKLSDIASAAAFRSRSSSSSTLLPLLSGLSLASLSSSLSPRLNGSFSAMGLGSTADSGCHLLALPAEPGASFGPFLGEAL